MNDYSSQSLDTRTWSKCLTGDTLLTYLICGYVHGGNICVVLALMSYEITGSTYTMFFSLYQFLAILVLAGTSTFIYNAPTGSLEELNGPNSRQFATTENFGHILCYTISVWFLWWFWIDYKLIPFCFVAFGYSLHYSSKWILGVPMFLGSRFPSNLALHDEDNGKDSTV